MEAGVRRSRLSHICVHLRPSAVKNTLESFAQIRAHSRLALPSIQRVHRDGGSAEKNCFGRSGTRAGIGGAEDETANHSSRNCNTTVELLWSRPTNSARGCSPRS